MNAHKDRRRSIGWMSALVCCVVLVAGGASASASPGPALRTATADAAEGDWIWPVEGVREVVERFAAPAHEYGPGHRGIDIDAPAGTEVHAPAAGVVAFRGVVVDRPLITIDHGGGVVTTFEPLESSLSPGDVVSAGDVVGVVASGGHASAGTLHIGVRVDGVYVDPLLMFGGVARAVLLPCCGAL